MGIGIIINRGASQEPWNGLDAARRVPGNPGGSHMNSVENIDQNTVDWIYAYMIVGPQNLNPR